jgi:hypothetical protein
MRLIPLLSIGASCAFAFQTDLNINVRNAAFSSTEARTSTALSGAGGVKQRLTFNSPPPLKDGKTPPKLILIAGCPGTGKSTFGMSLALEQGILKCISTDTVRAVMRSYVPESISPPLHRSSYGMFRFVIFAIILSSFTTITDCVFRTQLLHPKMDQTIQ